MQDITKFEQQSSFQLDARNIEKTLSNLYEYAALIPFSNGKNKADKNWAQFFFPQGKQDIPRLADLYRNPELADGTLAPHLAFLLSFLRQLEVPRGLLNRLALSHRTLFYQDFLQLTEPRTAQGDHVAISFSLTADTKELLIPKDCLLDAGKDASGFALNYRLDAPLLANQGFLEKLIFTQNNNELIVDVIQASQRQGQPLLSIDNLTSQCTLQLQFNNISPGQKISLYWKVRTKCRHDVKWEYKPKMENDTSVWTPLDGYFVDDTDGLFRSGLWTLTVPMDAPGKDCLLLVTFTNTKNHSPFVVERILVNAMTAHLFDANKVDNIHFVRPLPAETIRQLRTQLRGVQAVSQTLPSEGGRPAETQKEFDLRISQRLQHRERAVRWKDIEPILREQFAEVAQVITPSLAQVSAHTLQQNTMKTTNNTLSSKQDPYQVVVIPAPGFHDDGDALRPLFSGARLEEMERYMRFRCSPFLKFEFCNPTYCTVDVDIDVVFTSQIGNQYGQTRLAEILSAFYMPWSGNENIAIHVGNELDYFQMMGYIQRQEFVQQVNSLKFVKHDSNFTDRSSTASAQSVLRLYAKPGEVLVCHWNFLT